MCDPVCIGISYVKRYASANVAKIPEESPLRAVSCMQVHWDTIYFVFGVSSGLLSLREGLGKPVGGISLLGAVLALVLCIGALALQHASPATYAAYRDRVLVLVKAASVLSHISLTSVHAGPSTEVTGCLSLQAVLLAAQCLARNQVSTASERAEEPTCEVDVHLYSLLCVLNDVIVFFPIA
jgi:hypothetical protein